MFIHGTVNFLDDAYIKSSFKGLIAPCELRIKVPFGVWAKKMNTVAKYMSFTLELSNDHHDMSIQYGALICHF